MLEENLIGAGNKNKKNPAGNNPKHTVQQELHWNSLNQTYLLVKLGQSTLEPF